MICIHIPIPLGIVRQKGLSVETTFLSIKNCLNRWKGKKIQIIFIDTPTVFPGKNSQGRKQFLAETYNGKCLHFLLQSEVLGTLGTTFDVINRGSFMSIAI